MPVTKRQVLAQINRDEPNYTQAAQLGTEALPHLMQIIEEGDPGSASKATYLAAFIDADQSVEVIEKAALSPHSVVRVAAAGSLRYLKKVPTSLILHLLSDQNVGTRKLALKSIEAHKPSGVRAKVQDIANNDPEVGLRKLATKVIDFAR